MFKIKTPSSNQEYASSKELLKTLAMLEDKPFLILIRGLPGSGKTTLAKELFKEFNFKYFEADMYFEEEDGTYVFDKTLLKSAHSWCFNETIFYLRRHQTVCVANTFVKKWEMQRYIDAAKDFNIKLIIIECFSQYNSIHNVPEEAIERMKRQWESI